MMMKRELHTFIIGSVLFFTACGDKQESEQKSGYRIQGDTVYIADPLLLEKIKVSVSELKPYSKKVITSGVVRPIPPRYAYVAPPFAGIVTKSYVRIGQSVRQGTPLFEISSPDFTSAQKEYFQALSSRELAKEDFEALGMKAYSSMGDKALNGFLRGRLAALEMQEVLDAAEEQGADKIIITYLAGTVLPAQHSSWMPATENTALHDWMFSQVNDAPYEG